jgi:septal ring factor EnvC (AmiA/AmiB activator)
MNINYLLAEMTRAELEQVEQAIKTRKLEIEYDELLDKFTVLKDESDKNIARLQGENSKLKEQISYLAEKLQKTVEERDKAEREVLYWRDGYDEDNEFSED